MSYATDRVQLFDRDMNPLRELAPSEVFSRKRTEEVNGEHELVITTTRKLEEGWRALTVDGTGKWREWVVTEIDEDHSSGKTAMGTYRFVWSLQYDLTYSYAHTHAEIGYGPSPKTAIQVAGVVLEGVPDWTVGDCDAADVPASTGAVMIYESAWSRLSKAVECLGCEVEADIEVSNLYGVTARKLCLMAHVGSEVATRRFDWGHDLTDIKRTPDPGPYYCRVVPLGKGEQEYAEDDETTFDWPMDITDETGDPNLYYIEDGEAAQAFRVKKSDGSYYYPTIAVKYDEDDPELLLNAAQDDLQNHTRPGVTYEASVAQFSQAGMDTHGVALGDEVQCVDSGFNEDAPLRIQGRVIKMEVDELSPDTTTQLTIGQLRGDMTSVIAELDATFNELTSENSRIRASLAGMTTSRYIDELLNRINAEINATGGYAYFVPGEGIITYDTAVADPLVGSEATKVVQIKGGSIRIADTKESGFAGIDDWEWKTVFTSGHILSDLITAVKITSGYIGNATNSNYWNLDTGELVLRMLAELLPNHGSGTIRNQVITTKHGVVAAGNDLYWRLNGHYTYRAPYELLGLKVSRVSTATDGTETETGNIMLVPQDSTADYTQYGSFYYKYNAVASIGNLRLVGNCNDVYAPMLSMSGDTITLNFDKLGDYSPTDYESLTLTRSNGVNIYSRNGTTTAGSLNVNDRKFTVNGLESTFNDGLKVNNNLTVDYKLTVTNGSSSNEVVITSAAATIPETLTVGKTHLSYPAVNVTDGAVYSGTGSFYRSSVLYDFSVGRSGSTADVTMIWGGLQVRGDLTVTGSGGKSRAVDTDSYGTRLLYCYETATPYFGDIGSGTLDEEGFCYVQIEDVFSESVFSSGSYQVFLQKCGKGDLWVSEKQQNYFVVEGTPGLAFDWEIKARQRGLENQRLDDLDSRSVQNDSNGESKNIALDLENAYDPDLEYNDVEYTGIDEYIAQIEQLYDEAA